MEDETTRSESQELSVNLTHLTEASAAAEWKRIFSMLFKVIVDGFGIDFWYQSF